MGFHSQILTQLTFLNRLVSSSSGLQCKKLKRIFDMSLSQKYIYGASWSTGSDKRCWTCCKPWYTIIKNIVPNENSSLNLAIYRTKVTFKTNRNRYIKIVGILKCCFAHCLLVNAFIYVVFFCVRGVFVSCRCVRNDSNRRYIGVHYSSSRNYKKDIT